MSRIKYLIILAVLAGCGTSFRVIDKPVSFSQERESLTRQYINSHYGKEVDNITIEPKIIVLHWTAIDNFDSCYNLFNRELLGNSRPGLSKAGLVNVSIQFLVNQDGKVYQLMEDNKMARHCIGLNYNSIGVENVGGGSNIDNLTDEQIEANINLVEYLVKKYPSIEYLIGHHQYREFEGHPLWLEKDNNYRTKKSDPGERFMNAVWEGLQDLRLKGVEEIRNEKSLL